MAFENLIAIQYSTNTFKLSITNNIHADDKKSDFLELFNNVIPIWEQVAQLSPTIRLSHDDILARHQKHLIIIYRRGIALQGGLVMAKTGRLELGDNIYGYYKSIFNHCDVFGQQSNRIR